MSQPRVRRRATARSVSPLPSGEALQHELAVHQEELRAQNEKLVSAMQSLEETRDRYVELYDFAPNGYMTLDARGFVRDINLTALAMLGTTRTALLGLPILRFIPPDHRAAFLKYLNRCRIYTGGPCPDMELPLETPQGARLVQLTCRPRGQNESRAQQLFTTLIDVTEQRRLEAEREEARRRHAALVRQMLSILERERHRMARDIHDDLGQQVTALRMKLDWLASLVASDEELCGPVATVQSAASAVDRHVDFLLRELRPAGLEELGLVPTLTGVVREWGATFGVAAEFRSAGMEGRRLPPEVETHVFRIVQEALNNVHKHAAAKAVSVRLERRDARIALTIADDGSGFDPSRPSTAKRKGLGLLGMHERAALIGGELRVQSILGRGTTLTVDLPIG
jgi:PAS domain S-box-containing protein